MLPNFLKGHIENVVIQVMLKGSEQKLPRPSIQPKIDPGIYDQRGRRLTFFSLH